MANTNSNIVGKQKLSETLREILGCTVSQANKSVDAMLATMKTALDNGGTVRLGNMGVLVKKAYGERAGRNPQTGEKIVIPAREVYRMRGAKVNVYQ